MTSTSASDNVGKSTGQNTGQATWAAMADRVRAADRIAVTTHARPDGDALGSSLALARALVPAGKSVEILLAGPVEPALRTLAGSTPYTLVDDQAPGDDHDLVIIVDTCAWPQLEPLAAWLRARHDRVVCLDHHPEGDDDVASLRIVDALAPAAATLVVRLLDELGCDLGRGAESAAEALFVALATDTGWFRFSSAGADAFGLAVRLLACDVDNARLHRMIEETYRPARLALEARALGSLDYALDGRVAIQALGPDDFRATGTGVEELTAMVNRPMIVGSVRVSILLAEVDPGRTKISFRAKPGDDDDPLTDMNHLAGRIGGGGHRFAAGARIDAPLEKAKRKVLEALGG